MEQELIERLDRIAKMTVISAKEFLSMREAALYLDCGIDELYKRKNEITSYKPGRRYYFRKSDLDAWIEKSRQLSDADINHKAAIYCDNH